MPDGDSRPHWPERRRFPRQAATATARLRFSVEAEVIDVSLTGALLRCDCRLRIGDHIQIQAVLQREPFVASAFVRRVADARAGQGSTGCVGVAFSGLSQDSAALLQRFLEQATHATRDQRSDLRLT